MEKVIIKSSRWLYILLLPGSLGVVAAGVWMIADGEAFGWVAVAFFGGGALISIWQIFDRRPRLLIDDEGIYDRTLGVGVIPWEEITGAYVRSIQGNDFICLDLRHPEAYLQKLSRVKRAMASANEALGFTPLNINLSGIHGMTEQVFELILKQAAQHSL